MLGRVLCSVVLGVENLRGSKNRLSDSLRASFAIIRILRRCSPITFLDKSFFYGRRTSYMFFPFDLDIRMSLGLVRNQSVGPGALRIE